MRRRLTVELQGRGTGGERVFSRANIPGKGREGEQVWGTPRCACGCAAPVRSLASGCAKNRDLVAVFEAVVRGAEIVAEGAQKLSVPFPLVRQLGGVITGFLGSAQQLGVRFT